MNAEAADLEEKLLMFLKSLRGVLSSKDTNAIIFTIHASGRVDGELQIQFRLENEYDSKANVSGGTILPVVAEYMHRLNFNKRNAPLCLPNVEPPPPPQRNALLDDEIPF